MHDQEKLASSIRSFILQHFPAARKSLVDDQVPLLSSGIVDSLGMLDLVSFLEKSFSIQIADEELTPENFATVATLASFVQTKRPRVGAAAQ